MNGFKKMRSVKSINIKALFLFCCFMYLFTPLAAVNASSVMLKDWWEYTEREKKSLRDRWTEKQVEAIFTALKDGKPLPEFFPTQYTDQESLLSKNDLRGITHFSQVLLNIDLCHICLQGAKLMYSNLDSANLTSTNLQGAVLEDVSMQGDTMEMTDLRHAWLRNANLQGARMSRTNIQDANLTGANLRYTWLWRANLQSADLTNAKLQHAQLGEANLESANLFQAVFDTTYLWLANLGTAKNIRYIIWGDTLKSRYYIGEEIKADSTKTYEDFSRAEITYRDLKSWYKKEQLDDIAAEFHYRENEVITNRYLRTIWNPLNYLWGMFRYISLRLTYGYGSYPIWLLRDSVIAISVFILIFVILTIPRKTKSGIYLVVKDGDTEKEELLTFRKGRLFLDCFYFSLLSFATFGYGAIKPKQWLQFFLLEPKEYKPVRWARIFVGIEAALGIWIFALLVTVLFGK